MNKAIIIRFTMIMLFSVFGVIASQAQQSGSEVTTTANDFAPNFWYACTYGDYAPACDAIDDSSSDDATLENASSNALGFWYACTYGDYQPACETISVPAYSYNIT